MSVAWVGVYSQSGMAAMGRAAAAYQQNVASGDWNKMREPDRSKGETEPKIHSDSLKKKYVTIDGVRMTYNQANRTYNYMTRGGTTIPQSTVARQQTNSSTGGTHYGVRVSSYQAGARAIRNPASKTRNMVVSDKQAKQLKNRLTSAQKSQQRANGKYTQKVKSNWENYNKSLYRATKTPMPKTNSKIAQRKQQNKSASTRKNKKSTRKRYSSRRRR